ncbi:MAG: hypothetical protein KDA46_11780 [Parvularculaceae bacterium]|nr:hypothetical protein [Parvularculaceae bacterium]
MKSMLFLAAASLALVAAAKAETYNLRLAQDGEARTIAVSTHDDASFAVASGGDNLAVLTGDEAASAFAALKDAVKSEEIAADLDDFEHSADGHRKIVVHKMDVDDHDQGDDHEVRVVKKSVRREQGAEEITDIEVSTRNVTQADGDDAAMAIIASDDSDGDEEALIIGASDAPEESFKISLSDELSALEAGEKVKTVKVVKRDGTDELIEITGASADAAREFIDDAEGVDSLEAAAMRRTVGL